ncbi:MAG: sulfotransferase, partial [Chloroflexota bacterium]|nr:sulfotransferase [Chloroflexota bacterium]
MQDKVKVLYIAGFGRSGSTIMDNILGQLDGVFSGGELRSLWYHGLTGNILCGCGERFRECPVWERVLTTAYGSVENAPAEEMVRLSAGARSRHLPLMLLPRSRERVLSGLGAYREHLSTMYRAIQTTT